MIEIKVTTKPLRPFGLPEPKLPKRRRHTKKIRGAGKKLEAAIEADPTWQRFIEKSVATVKADLDRLLAERTTEAP